MSVLLLELVDGDGGACSGCEAGDGVPGEKVASWAAMALAAPGSRTTCQRFLRAELKWFLMALSDRPGRSLAIWDHLGPSCRYFCGGGGGGRRRGPVSPYQQDCAIFFVCEWCMEQGW